MFQTRLFRNICLLTLIAMTHSAFADWTLNELMNSRDKKRTGISKLSSRQKKALQVWIKKNFVLKTAEQEPSASNIPKTMPHVSEVLQRGRYLKLSDNSVWEIRPADRPTVESWITPATIDISITQNQYYPYSLKNQTTKSVILAKKVAPLIEQDEEVDGIETNVKN